MKQYEQGFKERIKPPKDPVTRAEIVEPFRDAQTALMRGKMASRERAEFFDEVFTDILTDLFTRWLKTEPHAQKEREFLYHSALALGDTKSRLLQYEMRGKNQAHLLPKAPPEDTNEQA